MKVGTIICPKTYARTSLSMPIDNILSAEVLIRENANGKDLLRIKVLKADGVKSATDKNFISWDASVFGWNTNAISERKQPRQTRTGSVLWVYANNFCILKTDAETNSKSDNETIHQTEFQKAAGYIPMSLGNDIQTLLILD